MYRNVQQVRCLKTNDTTKATYVGCPTTSWLGYVIGGVELIIQSLYETVSSQDEEMCPDILRRKIFR